MNKQELISRIGKLAQISNEQAELLFSNLTVNELNIRVSALESGEIPVELQQSTNASAFGTTLSESKTAKAVFDSYEERQSGDSSFISLLFTTESKDILRINAAKGVSFRSVVVPQSEGTTPITQGRTGLVFGDCKFSEGMLYTVKYSVNIAGKTHYVNNDEIIPHSSTFNGFISVEKIPDILAKDIKEIISPKGEMELAAEQLSVLRLAGLPIDNQVLQTVLESIRLQKQLEKAE
jgi:hypothetical protein